MISSKAKPAFNETIKDLMLEQSERIMNNSLQVKSTT